MSIDWNWGIFLQQAPFGNTTYLGWIWSGFQVTIALSICAWIIAFLVGSFFGILRTVPNRFLSGLGTLYVELFRNVPLIVQFFTWYLVIPELLPEKIGRDLHDPGDAGGILGRQRRDGAHAVHPVHGHGFQISLNSGASAAVAACNGQCCFHGIGLLCGSALFC